MSRTNTRYVDFQKLEARGESAVTVVKLMMACNDLLLADEAHSEWNNNQSVERKSRKIGARLYFMRIQLAHLHEGLKIVEQIKGDSTLLTVIDQCDSQTQESFKKLEQFLPGGAGRRDFDN